MARFSSAMGVVHLGGAALDARMTYTEMKEKGENPTVLGAVGRAALNATLYELPLTKPFMYAGDLMQLGMVAGEMGNKLYHASIGHDAKFMRANFGGDYFDTEEKATMRRRGLAAIQASRSNARSVLGNEARRLHR